MEHNNDPPFQERGTMTEAELYSSKRAGPRLTRRALDREGEQMAEQRPGSMTEEHLVFLDVRGHGFFAALPRLMGEFPDLSREEANAIVRYWFDTFEERHPSS